VGGRDEEDKGDCLTLPIDISTNRPENPRPYQEL